MPKALYSCKFCKENFERITDNRPDLIVPCPYCEEKAVRVKIEASDIKKHVPLGTRRR